MQEISPEHGNSKNEKLDKDTVEEDKSTDMERSTVGTKKGPDSPSGVATPPTNNKIKIYITSISFIVKQFNKIHY